MTDSRIFHLPPSLRTSLCRFLLPAPPDVSHQEVVLWLLKPHSTPSSAPLPSLPPSPLLYLSATLLVLVCVYTYIKCVSLWKQESGKGASELERERKAIVMCNWSWVGGAWETSQALTLDLSVGLMGVWPIHYLPPHTHMRMCVRAHTQPHYAIPAGEASDCAMSAAMAEFEFSLLPNMCEGARLKTDPDSPLTCGQMGEGERIMEMRPRSTIWQKGTRTKQREQFKPIYIF